MEVFRKKKKLFLNWLDINELAALRAHYPGPKLEFSLLSPSVSKWRLLFSWEHSIGKQKHWVVEGGEEVGEEVVCDAWHANADNSLHASVLIWINTCIAKDVGYRLQLRSIWCHSTVFEKKKNPCTTHKWNLKDKKDYQKIISFLGWTSVKTGSICILILRK